MSIREVYGKPAIIVMDPEARVRALQTRAAEVIQGMRVAATPLLQTGAQASITLGCKVVTKGIEGAVDGFLPSASPIVNPLIEVGSAAMLTASRPIVDAIVENSVTKLAESAKDMSDTSVKSYVEIDKT